MKRLRWIYLLVVFASLEAFAEPDTGGAGQAESQRTTVLTLTSGVPIPIPSAWQSPGIRIGYTRELSPRVALALGAGLGFQHQSNVYGTNADGKSEVIQKSWSVSLEPSLRFFLAGRAPLGLWVGPFMEAGYQKGSSQNVFTSGAEQPPLDWRNQGNGHWWGTGLLGGFTHAFDSGFAVHLAAGVGAQWDRGRSTSSSSAFLTSPSARSSTSSSRVLGHRLELGLGWAF